MIYRIVHTTTYEYTESAEACHNAVRLHPRTTRTQSCWGTTLNIDPAPASLHSYLDYFGNRVHSFAVYEPHRKLSITAESQVAIELGPGPDLAAAPPWNEVRRQLRADRAKETIAALQYIFDSPYIRTDSRLRDFAAPHFSPGRPLWEAAYALARHIHEEFTFDPKATTIDTSVDDVLDKRQGVCQDFAHLQIACLRSLGLACRYVSGYLRTDPRPGMPRLLGADASHAWVSVFCPGAGWLDFDPTNGCLISDRHATIGWGRDYHDVSPAKGVVLGGGTPRLRVAVDVAPAAAPDGADSH